MPKHTRPTPQTDNADHETSRVTSKQVTTLAIKAMVRKRAAGWRMVDRM
ncbi:MAG: hypothetical protein JWL81_554 [Verrucomicrobiales bacterium]|nr:hypothetical protein [Verrucomicrobiales bacterium]